MKKLKRLSIFFAFLFTLLGCSNSNSVKNDLFKNNLKGKVKSVKSKTYETAYKLGKLEKGRELFPDAYSEINPSNEEFIYNEKGNLVFRIIKVSSSFDRNWHTQFKYLFLYNNKNKLEEIIKYSTSGNDKEVVFYEELKTLTKNRDISERYTYDDLGNIIKAVSWITDKNSDVYRRYCSSILTYQYNKKNHKKEEIYFTDDCLGVKVNSRVLFTYKYDDKGGIIQIEEKTMPQRNSNFGGDKALYLEFPNGYISNIKNFDSVGNEIETIAYYHSFDVLDGNPNNHNPGNYTISTKKKQTIKKFDKFNNVIEMNLKVTGEKEILYTYEYKYDSTDNWIEKIFFMDDTPKIIVERELVYY